MEIQNIQSTITSLSATQITIVASAVGAVVAAFIAAIFSMLTTWLVKRAENERALRELVIKSAIELHNQHIDQIVTLKNQETRGKMDLLIYRNIEPQLKRSSKNDNNYFRS